MQTSQTDNFLFSAKNEFSILTNYIQVPAVMFETNNKQIEMTKTTTEKPKHIVEPWFSTCGLVLKNGKSLI